MRGSVLLFAHEPFATWRIFGLGLILTTLVQRPSSTFQITGQTCKEYAFQRADNFLVAVAIKEIRA